VDSWIGIDLGQLTDPTAAVVMRRTVAIDRRGRAEVDGHGRPYYRFDVAGMRRYPLGTAYAAIIEHILGQLDRPELGRHAPKIVIDGSGVGVPVVEMFHRELTRRGRSIECYDVVITAGRAVSKTSRWTWHVAKIRIAGAIREALDCERLKVPKEVDQGGILRRELQDFKVKITEAGNETFSAREGAHDDLVLATALPIWVASQPVMEMVIDINEDGQTLRPWNLPWMDEKIEAIEEAEREAVAPGRGIMTPKLRDKRRRLAALALRDEWDAELWEDD
jgi:hypothetical protein